MVRSISRIRVLALSIFFLASAPASSFANTVNVTANVTGFLYGNSSTNFPGASGNLANLDPNGNTLNNNGYNFFTTAVGAQSLLTGDTVSRNTVNITGNPDATAGVMGGSASAGDATYNTVNIENGQLTFVYGGHSVSGNADHNTVTIDNGTFLSNSSGTSVVGGYAVAQSANSNTIIIHGGDFHKTVAGGFGGVLSTATNDNTLIINGGIFHNIVSGGYSLGGNAEANNNTVTISGTPNLTEAYLNGGISSSGRSYGNTLNLHSAGLTVAALGYFQNLNFFLPASLSNGGTMLTVTGEAEITEAEVNVGIAGAASLLQTGDSIVLIDASGANVGLIGAPANTASSGQGMQGVTLLYGFTITTENNQLIATVAHSGPSVDPQTKPLSEGLISGMGLVTQGADVAAGQGLDSAVKAANAASAGGYGMAGFGSVSGGAVRYNTGSHVDMNSASLLTGLAWGVDITPGKLSLGAFFEYGSGSYDTYNSFSNAASTTGKGNSHYLGGGLLGRLNFTPSGPGHVYVEASGRSGKMHNEYANSDIRDAAGRRASYDSSAVYYGLHLGTGYVWNITEQASLDLHSKYFWTHQEGDIFRLSTGDPIHFESVDSSRLRFGSRFSYAVNEYVSPYVGAAYEHEFDSIAHASTNGYAIDTPSLRGDTGIGELGLSFTPHTALPVTFDLGVQGYTGKREGVTGSLQAKFEF